MQITLDTSAVAGVVGAVFGSLATLGVAWTKMVRPIQQLVEDWKGEPARPQDGIVERPGMMKRMALVEAEMRTNHGTSLRDAVDRIETNMAAHVASHAVSLYAPPPRPYGQDGTQHEGQTAA